MLMNGGKTCYLLCCVNRTLIGFCIQTDNKTVKIIIIFLTDKIVKEPISLCEVKYLESF